MIPAMWPDSERTKVLSRLPIFWMPLKEFLQSAIWSVSHAIAINGLRTSLKLTFSPINSNLPFAKLFD